MSAYRNNGIVGMPELILYDSNNNLTSWKFQVSTHALGIRSKTVPPESLHLFSIVQWTYLPFRSTSIVFTSECPALYFKKAVMMWFKFWLTTPAQKISFSRLFCLAPTKTVRVTTDPPSFFTNMRAQPIQKAQGKLLFSLAANQVWKKLATRNSWGSFIT